MGDDLCTWSRLRALKVTIEATAIADIAAIQAGFAVFKTIALHGQHRLLKRALTSMTWLSRLKILLSSAQASHQHRQSLDNPNHGTGLGTSIPTTYALNRGPGQPQSMRNLIDQYASTFETDGGQGAHTLESSLIVGAKPEGVQATISIDNQAPKSPLDPTHRKPRPSLSDRTVKTLSQVPPSPSPSRRKSSFFTSQSSMDSPARPTSSMSRSRPSTSAGHYPLPTGIPTSRPISPTKRHLAPATGNKTPLKTPGQRSVSSFVPRGLPAPVPDIDNALNDTPSKVRPGNPCLNPKPESGGHIKATSTSYARGSKTLAARSPMPRHRAKDAFVKPDRQLSGGPVRDARGVVQPFNKRTANRETPPEAISQLPALAVDNHASAKSSAALRETIAKAKAARRAVSKTQNHDPTRFRAAMDAFPEIELGGSNKTLLRKRIASARNDGRLNIAAMGLKELPREILEMYDTSEYDNDGSWAESVDLIKLVAADNEISSLGDQFFPSPDASAQVAAEHDHPGNIFGGLETLDLHGNSLRAMAPGLAALERLTILNVSKNCLDNHSLNILSRVMALRELRVADNDIRGNINPDICELTNLEVLDLSRNGITELPPNIANLSALKSLLVSGNRLSSLPMKAVAYMSVRELDASRNNLKGCLFPAEADLAVALKSIDVSHNALTSISENDDLTLPTIQTLNISENRIRALPKLSGWTNLITLTADGNQITDIPVGLINLPALKNMDFARNDVRQLDARIGLMDSLTVFRVANNPIRERRLLNLDTEDLKRELRSRLDQLESLDDEQDIDDTISDGANGRVTSTLQKWSVQMGGTVDRSSTNLQAIEASDLEPLIERDDIKTLVLNHNAITIIPQAIGLLGCTLTALDLSHNKLAGQSFLGTALSLPKLKTLNLSANALSSLTPLLDFLSAPALTELNVSRNRLSALPILRTVFPTLTAVLAADNSISDLPVHSVRGLQVLDVGGNDISFLEPKLGLLGDEGLRRLSVAANRFRVPRRDVVEKGTEAILTWLRSKIPDN
ncbi:MAG: hypothetical protein Q9163_002745 [Psora crenata]